MELAECAFPLAQRQMERSTLQSLFVSRPGPRKLGGKLQATAGWLVGTQAVFGWSIYELQASKPWKLEAKRMHGMPGQLEFI